MHKPIDAFSQRRLAAIFYADVAGFSRAMHSDEPATIRLLTACRDLVERLITQYNGRVANTGGDSILAEFSSALDAVQSALDIQMGLTEANRDAFRPLRFRIGIHVGEVTVRGGDLFGDGVNIAARIQALAAPGHVVLSEDAHHFAKALPIQFSDAGLYVLKNIDTPVRLYDARSSKHAPMRELPLVHRRIEAHLARRFHDVCRRALFDITGPEGLEVIAYSAIASLSDAPGLCKEELAERIGVSARKAASVLAQLESRRLVERTGADRRSPTAFSLTPEGLALRVRLRPVIVDALDRVMAPLSEDERETLRDLLIRIIQADSARTRLGTKTGTSGTTAA